MDDLIDGSLTRKNNPAAHVVYGMPHSVVSGTFGILNVIDRMFKSMPKEVAALCVHNFAANERGTAVEIYWRDTFYCPDEFEYLGVNLLKWYYPFEVMTLMLQSRSDCKKNFHKLMRMMATFYAVTNDYSDFYPSSHSEGKKFCDDITEGKFNFPVIHAVRVKRNDEVYGRKL